MAEKKYPKGKHPNSMKNLKICGPGQQPPGAGNRKCTPSFPALLKRALTTTMVTTDDLGLRVENTVLDGIIAALISKGKDGDIPAIKEIFDRYVGKTKSVVEVSGKDGEPLQVEHVQLASAYDSMKNVFDVEKGADESSEPKDNS